MPARINRRPPFKNRLDAGRQLAKALQNYAGHHAVVFALPRGGVPVGAEVARSLNALLDLLIVRKLGVPGDPELAMGAVVEGTPPVVVRNEGVISACGVGSADFDRVLKSEQAEARRRRRVYLGQRRQVDAKERTAILVDDGIATGSSARAAIMALRSRHPARLVLAIPVAPAAVVKVLRGLVDELICLHEVTRLDAVGSFYDDFGQLTDDDVVTILDDFTGVGDVSPRR